MATSDADAFDLVHRLHGVGDWDPDLDAVPWHKVRMREISKIKAMRTKRRMSPDDIVLLARYCAEHRIRIAKSWDLLEHWPAAVRWRAANERLCAGAELEARREAALMVERRRPDGEEWAGRIARAVGPGLVQTLDQWERERKRDAQPDQDLPAPP